MIVEAMASSPNALERIFLSEWLVGYLLSERVTVGPFPYTGTGTGQDCCGLPVPGHIDASGTKRITKMDLRMISLITALPRTGPGHHNQYLNIDK